METSLGLPSTPFNVVYIVLVRLWYTSCTSSLFDCGIQTTVGGSSKKKEDGDEQEKDGEEEMQVKGREEEEDENDEEGGWNDLESEHGEREQESDTELEEEEEEEEEEDGKTYQTCDVGQVDQSWSHSLPLGIHESIA